MKRAKWYACMMVLAFALMCMTGCSDQNSTGQTGTSGNQATISQTTSAVRPTTDGGTTDTTTGTDRNADESGKGVIDGIIDGVKNDVEDITGETTTGTTNPSR